MHGISNHIAKVLTELPSQVVNLELKQLIKETITLTVRGKKLCAFDLPTNVPL